MAEKLKAEKKNPAAKRGFVLFHRRGKKDLSDDVFNLT
jgi:hypothetical protein